MIKIITGNTENFSSITEITHPYLIKYCKLHKIDYEIIKIQQNYERPFSWFKIKEILLQLDQDYKYFLWLDADTLIINQHTDINKIIASNKILYISKDFNNINCGVMIWKNSELSKQILSKIYSMTEYLNHQWWEQAALIELIEINYLDINNNIEYVDQNILNAYKYKYYIGNDKIPQNSNVDKDSFILHVPGKNNTQRIKIIQDCIKEFNL